MVEVHTKFNQHSDTDTGQPRPIIVINDFSKNIRRRITLQKIKNLTHHGKQGKMVYKTTGFHSMSVQEENFKL